MTPPRHDSQDPEVLRHYEGLIRKTASRVAGYVEDDYDDIVQTLRIKVWRALVSYDPERCRTSRDSYVFSCVFNMSKDLLKRKKLNVLFIEDIAPDGGQGNTRHRNLRDRFEERYLTVSPDDTYRSVEEDGTIRLPDSLNDEEREVVYMLYLEFNYSEIAEELNMTRRQVETTVGCIREKMADWKLSVVPAVAA